MAHELEIRDGQVRVYFGDGPWHGLGVQFDRPATAEEAIKAAGPTAIVRIQPSASTGGPAKWKTNSATAKSQGGPQSSGTRRSTSRGSKLVPGRRHTNS